MDRENNMTLLVLYAILAVAIGLACMACDSATGPNYEVDCNNYFNQCPIEPLVEVGDA
jgi:hypothetical protein